MPFDVEAIKASQTISKVIGERLNLRREGREFACLCPFHTERTPSFKVCDDKQMFYCFGCGAHGDVFDFIQRYHNVDFQTSCDILGGVKSAPISTRPKLTLVKPERPPLKSAPVPISHFMFAPGERIKAWKPEEDRFTSYTPDYVWPYCDLNGDITHYVIRIDFSTGKKIFVPLRPVWLGDEVVWATAHADTPRPLYGLERLRKEGPVFICEGEKSADACATLFPSPALSAPKGQVDFTPLQGREVVVWGDADEAGQKHAERVATALLSAPAASVRIVPWDSSRASGWDAADALAEGLTADELRQWMDEIADPVTAPIAIDDEAFPSALTLSGFEGEIPPPRPWAYGDFLMEGAVTGIPSPPGTGKTTFAMQIAIAFALDLPFGPWRPRPGGGGKVWLLNGEEPKEELDRRFLAACYDMDVDPQKLDGRLFYSSTLMDNQPMRLVVRDKATEEPIRTIHCDALKDTILANNIKLLVLDPLIEFHAITETHTEEFQAVGAAIRDIAVHTKSALAAFHHTPKSATSDTSAGEMSAMRGAGSLLGVVRFVVTMFRMSKADAEANEIPIKDRQSYVRIDGGKANMGPLDGGEHWFRLQGVNIDNASDPRPADSVAVLRYSPLKKDSEIEREERAEAKRSESLERLSEEIVRLCILNKWTASERAISVDSLCDSLDQERTKMASRTMSRLIANYRDFLTGTEEGAIKIVDDQKGKYTYRRIYVELADEQSVTSVAGS